MSVKGLGIELIGVVYVMKPQNLFGVVWRGFTLLKQPGKLTLGVFQNLLSNSVNSESLFFCWSGVNELAPALGLQDLLSYSVKTR